MAATAFAGLETLGDGGAQAGDSGEPTAAARHARAQAEGRAVFARMGCGGCHAFEAGNSTGAGAPNLDVALDGYTRRTLKAKILDPYSDPPPGHFPIMPEDFGRRLSDAELDALVSFLLEPR